MNKARKICKHCPNYVCRYSKSFLLFQINKAALTSFGFGSKKKKIADLSSPPVASILVFPLPVHSSHNPSTSEDPSGCDFLRLAP